MRLLGKSICFIAHFIKLVIKAMNFIQTFLLFLDPLGAATEITTYGSSYLYCIRIYSIIDLILREQTNNGIKHISGQYILMLLTRNGIAISDRILEWRLLRVIDANTVLVSMQNDINHTANHSFTIARRYTRR